VIERRIRSIPPTTSLDTYRAQIGRLSSAEPTQGKGADVRYHVFKRPVNKPAPREWENGEITWQAEIVKGLSPDGEMGLIMQFFGINFTSTSVFERSKRDYGPDNVVFYAPVSYKKGQVFLIFSTFGNIFESQVVPKTKDVNPLFQEEIYYPKLLTDYVPASMVLSYNNGLFIARYKARDN